MRDWYGYVSSNLCDMVETLNVARDRGYCEVNQAWFLFDLVDACAVRYCTDEEFGDLFDIIVVCFVVRIMGINLRPI